MTFVFSNSKKKSYKVSFNHLFAKNKYILGWVFNNMNMKVELKKYNFETYKSWKKNNY